MDASPTSTAPVKTPPHRTFQGLLWVSGLTVASRILGLLRDISMAAAFGVSPVMDAFTIAFRIPNLSRRLFGEGALATAFIPVFARTLAQPDRLQSWKLATAVVSSLSWWLGWLVLVGEVALLACLFGIRLPEDARLLVELTALMLPYCLLICVACQVGAVLNSLGQFHVAAVVPIVLNVIWLAGVWWLIPWFRDPAWQARALAVCILVSGFLQLGIQLPSLFASGFRWSAGRAEVEPELRDIWRALWPVVFGLSITQINTATDSLLAWGLAHPVGDPTARLPFFSQLGYPLSAGAVSALYYGERLYQFPLGVFGVALGTVIFPRLSLHAAHQDWAALREDLTRGLRMVLVIGIPASVALMWLAPAISSALFERGEFDAAASARTARIILAYGSGVWAYCAVLILQRACYACGDRKGPLKIGVQAVVWNLILNFSLIWWLGETGLAWSTALCATYQTIALLRILQTRLGFLDWKTLSLCLLRTACATALMSTVGIFLLNPGRWAPWLAGHIPGLIIPCVAGGVTYLIAAWIFRLEELIWILRKG